MAANRVFGLPTPPEPDDFDHSKCPVCGWNPCVGSCRLGLTNRELEDLESYFFEPPADWGNPDLGLPDWSALEDFDE